MSGLDHNRWAAAYFPDERSVVLRYLGSDASGTTVLRAQPTESTPAPASTSTSAPMWALPSLAELVAAGMPEVLQDESASLWNMAFPGAPAAAHVDVAWSAPAAAHGSETGLFQGAPAATHIAGGHARPAVGLIAGNGAAWSPNGPLQVVARREVYNVLTPDQAALVGRLYHLAYWDRHSRYCSRCGGRTYLGETEVVKLCDACGASFYPTISPAVIMAVVDAQAGKLLLAHSGRHPGKMFSVLAGFVEPGESLEQCVAREVFEESGVRVREVTYFASQPWAFPASMMIGFTALYAGGELRPQPGEIEEIGWFAPHELPAELPSRVSIAHRLIEWFVNEHGTPEQLRALWQ